MRFVYELLLIAALMIVVGIVGRAQGAEINCYHSASAVRAAHPAAWPSWGKRIPGHSGERCWFPAERKVLRSVSRNSGVAVDATQRFEPTRNKGLAGLAVHSSLGMPRSPAPSASAGVPLPRANVKKEFEEFMSAQAHIDETWWILTSARASAR